ncbi:tetratricopeptide repeat protein [Flaviaesturariibacter amylovorans]|uniref:Tetratricopeptide repeat protein n=1 Tax=Flaviaesturariibacter amylovorans TaxID=1084520 RepID=A0ABP8GBF8_9BACT
MKWLSTLLLALTASTAAAQADEVKRGNDFYREGNYAAAEQLYRRAGDNLTTKYNLANALIKQNRFDEALAVLAPLTTQTEDRALQEKAWYNTGVVYTKQKALEQSIDAYKSALRIDPADKEARDNLQKALLELKKQSGGGGGGAKMNNSEADKKLEQLKDKERKLQQSKQQPGGGNNPSKDW